MQKHLYFQVMILLSSFFVHLGKNISGCWVLFKVIFYANPLLSLAKHICNCVCSNKLFAMLYLWPDTSTQHIYFIIVRLGLGCYQKNVRRNIHAINTMRRNQTRFLHCFHCLFSGCVLLHAPVRPCTTSHKIIASGNANFTAERCTFGWQSKVSCSVGYFHRSVSACKEKSLNCWKFGKWNQRRKVGRRLYFVENFVLECFLFDFFLFI